MFSALLYYGILMPVSLLPFILLKGLSNFFFWVLYHLIGYRKKIVLENLKNSFPEKNETERIEICRAFYKHLSDLFLEGLKCFTISKTSLKKHIRCINPELVNSYFDKGQNIIIAIGHYNSWEMFLTGLNTLIKHQVVIIYQPLTNPYLNQKLIHTRQSFGTKMIATHEVKDFFRQPATIPTATIFAIDQSPGNSKNCYWMKFLNQETGVVFGTEKYAKDYDYPVLFARINKEKRNYYNIEFIPVTDNSKGTDYGYITETVTKQLEEDIIRKPEFWLWSHRRWKHKKEI